MFSPLMTVCILTALVWVK